MSTDALRRRLDRVDAHDGFPPIFFVDEGPGALTEEGAAEIDRLTQEHNGHVHIIRLFRMDMDEVDAAGLAGTFAAMSDEEEIEALRAYRRRSPARAVDGTGRA